MLKLIGGMFLGVFIGAMFLEIIERERPKLVEKMREKAKGASDTIFENLIGASVYRKSKS